MAICYFGRLIFAVEKATEVRKLVFNLILTYSNYFNPGEAMGSLMDFTLSDARRFYSSTWKVLGSSRVDKLSHTFF